MVVADSLWVSVTNWFTPAILFCILNLMIATIFIRSSLFKPDNKNQDANTNEGMTTTSPQLFPPPALLERVKSIRLSFRRSDQLDPSPPVLSHESQEAHEAHSESHHHVMRSQSENSAENGTAKRKMKKSASEKKVTLNKEKEEEEEEEVEERRPATVSGRNERWIQEEDEDGVDEKADDFINRFRQQLKLQRSNSIMKYREMLNRGASR